MPIIGYECKVCGKAFDTIEKQGAVPDWHPCPAEGCQGTADRVLTFAGHYSIKGNNSASITPKKYRGET